MARGRGSNAGKRFPIGRDDMGIDEVPKARKPFKGSGQQNISKGQPTSADTVTGKTRNTIGNNLK